MTSLGELPNNWREHSFMRNTLRVMLIALGVAVVQPPALATKPCLPSPCETKGGTIDAAKCRNLADWVATGTITNVVHHEQGDPLFKDFAEFTFTAQTSEKGASMVGREIRFQVGWCENAQPLPKDTSGAFRIFGLPLPKDASIPNQYLHFEALKVQRP
jgi:hypothetical protein